MSKLPLISKFMIIVVVMVFLPILTVIIIMASNIQNKMIDREISAVESTLDQITQSVESILRGQIFSISNMVMNDDKIYRLLTQEYDGGIVQKYIDTRELSNKINSGYGKIYQDVQIAALLGSNNVLYNLVRPTYENIQITEKVNHIKKNTRGITAACYGLQDNIFTDYRENNIRQSKVVILAMNIFMPKTGEYVGVQIYTFPEHIFYEKYMHTDLASSGNIFIFDAKGQLISSNREEYLRGESVLSLQYIEQIMKASQEISRTDGTLMATRSLGVNSWRISGEVPVSHVTAPVNRIFRFFWFIILWLVFVCMLGYAILSEKTIRPIKNIIKSVEKFEKGDIKAYIQSDNKSEPAILETCYNRMIDRINHHIVYEYEMDKQKRQLEYDVLMSQINSHFLSNTLESIVWEARGAGAFGVAKMASSLGKFFKLSQGKGNTFVTVEQEVAHAKAYVDIQKIRYKDKFNFMLEMDTQSYPGIGRLKTLKIILQPLVENSITHSLWDSDKVVSICVKIYVSEEMLVFEVSDDGVGISEVQLEDIKERMRSPVGENGSIGLRNVKERVKLYFESQYPKSDFIIQSSQGEGTLVRLILPIIQ